LFGPVLAGAVFDALGSYVPVIVGCLFLSCIATAASAHLARTQAPAY